MSIGNFDSAGLAVVGYAKVNPDGTTSANSGLIISRPSPGSGYYLLSYPTDPSLPPPPQSGFEIGQGVDRDLIVAMARNGAAVWFTVQESGPYNRVLQAWTVSGGSAVGVDTAFTVIVFRTTIPLPLAPTP